MVLTALSVIQTFNCWRSGAQNNWNVLLSGMKNRQISGMVTPAFLLFIGAVVFFINDNNAQMLKGSEQGGTGTNNNGGFSAAGP